MEKTVGFPQGLSNSVNTGFTCHEIALITAVQFGTWKISYTPQDSLCHYYLEN